jgi:hypothetical protein
MFECCTFDYDFRNDNIDDGPFVPPELNFDQIYYTITSSDSNSKECIGTTYCKDGLNTFTLDGYYFTDIQHIFKYLDNGIYVREVKLPKIESLVVTKHKYRSEWSANKLIFGTRRKLSDQETFTYLINLGAKLSVDSYYPIRWASINNHLSVLTYLLSIEEIEQQYLDIAVRDACIKGHLDIVKYLYSKGANINPTNGDCIKWACANGHIETVKYLIANGVNIITHRETCIRLIKDKLKQIEAKILDSKKSPTLSQTIETKSIESTQTVLDLLHNM